MDDITKEQKGHFKLSITTDKALFVGIKFGDKFQKAPKQDKKILTELQKSGDIYQSEKGWKWTNAEDLV